MAQHICSACCFQATTQPTHRHAVWQRLPHCLALWAALPELGQQVLIHVVPVHLSQVVLGCVLQQQQSQQDRRVITTVPSASAATLLFLFILFLTATNTVCLHTHI